MKDYIEFKRVFGGEEVIVRISTDSDLSHIAEAFGDFLKGSGYPLDYMDRIEIVEEGKE